MKSRTRTLFQHKLSVSSSRHRQINERWKEKKVAPLKNLCPDAKFPLELVEADLLDEKPWPDAAQSFYALTKFKISEKQVFRQGLQDLQNQAVLFMAWV